MNKVIKSVSDNVSTPKAWYERDKIFYLQSLQNTVENLPVGVYRLEESIFGLCLNLQSPEFSLPKKLYGTTTDLIQKIIKTWNKTTKDLGILFWGLKGTSKTVTAKIICNELNLPVIIVPSKYAEFASFIEDISQDVIILVDEFEKIFGVYDEDNEKSSLASLLSLIDGTNTNEYRRLWIFTSNSRYVDRNLLDRPSRIRYCIEFGALENKMILEIVNDLLVVEDDSQYKLLRDDLLTTISRLEFVTIDAVFALTEEVNIHQQLASLLIKDFNLQEKLEKYEVRRQQVDENENIIVLDGSVSENELVGVYFPGQMNKTSFNEHDEGDRLYLRRTCFGDIMRAVNDNQAIIKVTTPLSLKDRQAREDDAHELYTYWLYTFEPVYPSMYDFFVD